MVDFEDVYKMIKESNEYSSCSILLIFVEELDQVSNVISICPVKQ